MPEPIQIGRTLRIRDCGFDEYWLQDQIFQNPSRIGLGELEALSKEKTQSSGGRLDLLLKDSDDESMYEVEVMLGDTDEKHIIRTLEYWDNEKRRWPQRQHFAVLVAESFARRFFNVIQLLGQNVPIIALQANIVEAGNQRILSFTKVLDVYEEPAEPGSDELTTEEDWRGKAPWTLDAASALLEAVRPVCNQAALSFRKTFIGLRVAQNNYFWFNKRASSKSRLGFRMDSEDFDRATAMLDEAGMSYVKKPNGLRITTDKQAIVTHAETFRKIAEFVRKYWEG